LERTAKNNFTEISSRAGRRVKARPPPSEIKKKSTPPKASVVKEETGSEKWGVSLKASKKKGDDALKVCYKGKAKIGVESHPPGKRTQERKGPQDIVK